MSASWKQASYTCTCTWEHPPLFGGHVKSLRGWPSMRLIIEQEMMSDQHNQASVSKPHTSCSWVVYVHHRIPHVYGLPKVHKSFDHIPPMRLIIAHTNSLLQNSAKFTDHVLQPIAQSYVDYMKDSSDLIRQLQHLTFPKDTVYVP